MQPLAGDRVVIRYRLGAGGPDDWRAAPNPALAHTPSLSDLTGILRERTPEALIVEREGVEETVPIAAITSVRLLSRTVVRNSQIRAVERTLTEQTPAAERADLDGWSVSRDPDSALLRAGAAVPVGFGSSAAGLDRVRAWYAERGGGGWLIVPERLLRLADVTGGTAPGGGSTAGGGAAAGNGDTDGIEYEVLVAPDGRPAQVRGDDLAERRRLRAAGYGLHHTFRALPLD